jgi:hypothetical protein
MRWRTIQSALATHANPRTHRHLRTASERDSFSSKLHGARTSPRRLPRRPRRKRRRTLPQSGEGETAAGAATVAARQKFQPAPSPLPIGGPIVSGANATDGAKAKTSIRTGVRFSDRSRTET